MFSNGHISVTLDEILTYVSESQIVAYYLNLTTIPVCICSPLRDDKTPSFSITERDDTIFFKDFGTGESGNMCSLLMKLFSIDYGTLIDKLYNDFVLEKTSSSAIKYRKPTKKKKKNMEIRLEVKVREWRKYDIDYWNSYGCNIDLIKAAEVYPISHTIIYKNNQRYTFVSDKLAYVFIERKENKVTKKIYQPYNTKGYKWSNNNNKTIIGLWNMLPEKGDTVLICASLKDAICIMSNFNIPCVYVQSETTSISDTALNELKRRFTNIYIAFDGDESGIRDSKELSKKVGLPILWCPELEKAKDWSDLYHNYGKHTLSEYFLESLALLDKSDIYMPF